MSRFLSRGIILAGLLLSVGTSVFSEEKTPLYPLATWVLSDPLGLSFLNTCANMDKEDEAPVGFPNEINLDAGVNGIIVTDGNEQWTILSLGVRLFGFGSSVFSEKKLDEKTFRERLLRTGILSILYWDGKTKMLMRKGRLYLLSNGFPVDRLDELDAEGRWLSLQEKYRSAALFEHVEWKLYPELPPEKENEGTFLKRIRVERSKKDGQKDDMSESVLFALNLNEQDELKGALTTKLREGTEKSKRLEERQKREFPFAFSGFISGKESAGPNISAFYRMYPEDELFGDMKILLKGGITPLGPEDQKEGEPEKTSAFILAPKITSESIEKIREECLEEGYGMMEEGNLIFATPIYSDDIVDDKNYLKAKSENETFRKCLEAVHDLIRTVRIGTENWEKGKPIDLGLLMEPDTLTLAVSTPPGGTIPESPSILPLLDRANAYLEMLHSVLKDKYDFPRLSLHLELDETENVDGTKFSAGQITLKSETKGIPLVAFLSAVRDNELYVLQLTTKGFFSVLEPVATLFELPGLVDRHELKERHGDLFRQRVEQSLLGKRENRPSPECFARLNANGIDALLTETYSEREFTYSLTVRKDAIGLLGFLSGFLGSDAVRRLMPF